MKKKKKIFFLFLFSFLLVVVHEKYVYGLCALVTSMSLVQNVFFFSCSFFVVAVVGGWGVGVG